MHHDNENDQTAHAVRPLFAVLLCIARGIAPFGFRQFFAFLARVAINTPATFAFLAK